METVDIITDGEIPERKDLLLYGKKNGAEYEIGFPKQVNLSLDEKNVYSRFLFDILREKSLKVGYTTEIAFCCFDFHFARV